MAEQRQQERRNSLYYLKATRPDDGGELGFLADLSDRGLLMLMTTPPQVGDQFTMRLQLAQAIGDKETVDLDVQVKWAAPDDNPDYHKIGCELVKPSLTSLALLRETLAKHTLDAYQFKS